MGKTKILGIGLNGLVGSRIVELLSDHYEFENLSRTAGVDLTNRRAVLQKIKASPAEIVFHVAAKADVDGCEKDKEIDQEFQKDKVSEKEIIEKQTAWAINVLGTRNIADACRETNKKLISVSTDFVFGGDDTPADGYTETDTPNPVNWYAKTKYEGEKIIQNLITPWLIMRIAYPYRANFEKKEYVRIFLWLLQQGRQIKAITDHKMTPTFIDDIAPAFDILLKNNSHGVVHVTGSQSLTPYDIAIKVAEEFGLDTALIGKTTRAEFFKDRAPRPFDLRMNNAKIRGLGVKMRTFREGLDEIKEQMS